jgi:AcrR family transcriptional regulator
MRLILDAAMAQIELVGIRHASVNEIARRAGIGRVTLYWRSPARAP